MAKLCAVGTTTQAEYPAALSESRDAAGTGEDLGEHL